jgi:Flp pilus assembly protein TadB
LKKEMIQRSIFGVLVLFVVVALTQCTVQKRLYRKGYYISFHKTPKRGTEAKEEKPVLVVSEKDSTKTVEHNQVLETPSDMNDFPLSEEVTLPKTVKREYRFSQLRFTDLKDKVDYVGKLQFKSAKRATKNASSDDNKAAGIFLALAGLLILLVGMGVGLLSVILVDLITPWIGGLISTVGLILLIMGLILILAKKRDEKEEKIKRQKEEKKKREQSLSDEEWQAIKQQQYKKAIRVTALLVVLFFGISLFALAVGEPMPLIAITGAMFLIFIAFVWGTYKSKRPEESAIN